MNYKWITWIIFASLILVTALRPQQRLNSAEGQQAPLFSTQQLSGEAFTLSEQRGKVIVLDFWATWCGPCRQSLPALNGVAKAYANDPEVWVGSVNNERISGSRLQLFMSQLKLDFPVLLDQSNQISNDYGVSALPTLVIINPRGEISYRQVGLYSSYTPKLMKHLKSLIEKARLEKEIKTR